MGHVALSRGVISGRFFHGASRPSDEKADDPHTLHDQLLALSPDNFEQVVGVGLSGVLDVPFRQAASGRQLSGDVGGGTVRVEAKRYRTGIPSNRDLLGGQDSMARTVPDLSPWVVASTTELPLQAVDELAVKSQEVAHSV